MTPQPAQTPPSSSHEPQGTGLRTEWVLLGVALALFAYFIAPVLLLVFAGLALAVALDGLAAMTAARTPLSRGWAVLVIVLVLIGLLAAFIVAIPGQLAAQMDQMWQALDAFIKDAVEWLEGIGVTPELLGLGENSEDLVGTASTAMGHVARWGMTTLGALASFAVMLAVAGFAVADPALYRRGLVRLLPHSKRPLMEDTLSAVAQALRWWFLSQLVSMLMLGITVSAGLWVIGVDLWLGLGVLTALLTFVPYLGPVIAGIPILVIAFADSAQTGLIVTVFYLTVQNVESNIVVPMIQQKVVHLAPVLAIAAQVFFGLLFGLPGFILAAPLAVVGMVMVQKLWVEAVLGDEA
ncbi:MAG: AI-2E family transporter [Pararhodobacter sp.]|nr:AI-2E family transporter [Pararhodobacter sp.]